MSHACPHPSLRCDLPPVRLLSRGSFKPTRDRLLAARNEMGRRQQDLPTYTGHFDCGATTAAQAANTWFGGYWAAAPVAMLRCRLSARRRPSITSSGISGV
jgi:hypothetical protein